MIAMPIIIRVYIVLSVWVGGGDDGDAYAEDETTKDVRVQLL